MIELTDALVLLTVHALTIKGITARRNHMFESIFPRWKGVGWEGLSVKDVEVFNADSRSLDRALQSLRKRGLLSFDSKTGWLLTEEGQREVEVDEKGKVIKERSSPTAVSILTAADLPEDTRDRVLISFCSYRGKIYSVSDVLKAAEGQPKVLVPIKNLYVAGLPFWSVTLRVSWDLTEMGDFVGHVERVLRADLSYPILLAPDGETVLDGLHRIVRAHLENITHLNAIVVKKLPKPRGVK